MTGYPEIIENTTIADNVDDRDQEEIAVVSHWQHICAAGIAAVNAGCAAWLQLAHAAVVLSYNDLALSTKEKEKMRQSMLHHLLSSDRSCQGLLRMSPDCFKMLCDKLHSTKRLKNYRNTSTEEQVATFLFIIGQKFTNRAIAFFMCRSGETISRYFHNVLQALICLESELLQQPTENDYSDFIYKNERFFPYFKDCLGAVDGTHIRVKVSKLDAARYRGRKEWPTQNVLACCTFELRITYILAGWEGSASDSRVLKSALTRSDPLRIPNGKYYLGDSGFGLSSKILVPYGRTRYHLKKYAVTGPQNPQELFNLRHASLRNSIERCFGILKKRFPILSSGSESQYSCDTMTNVILGCCVLHNFLLKYEPEDVSSEDDVSVPSLNNATDFTDIAGCTSEDGSIEYEQGKLLRESIAIKMWEQYERDRERSSGDVSFVV